MTSATLLVSIPAAASRGGASTSSKLRRGGAAQSSSLTARNKTKFTSFAKTKANSGTGTRGVATRALFDPDTVEDPLLRQALKAGLGCTSQMQCDPP
jgi:hypothetical protein